jgi:hypothetical protein
MNRINWTQVGVFAAIVVVIFVIGVTLLPLVFGWYGGSSAMGPGMMGGQTQGGWCPFCGGTGRGSGGFFGGMFGWAFMLMAVLFPVGLLVLLILGVVWVARAVSRPTNQSASPGQTCPHCGKAVEVDWRACPFCAEDFERLG